MSIVEKQLEEVLSRYNYSRGMYERIRTSSREDEELYLENEIAEVFNSNPQVKEFKIHHSTMESDPGFSCGYVFAAWIEHSGHLFTKEIQWSTQVDYVWIIREE